MEIKIGFSPLNDAALIVVAEALGFYDSEGLKVTLSREANWSNIRDKLSYGLIDAAHILAPMPFASALGMGPSMGRIIAPMALGANGNSFFVSSELKARLEAVVLAQESLTKSLLMENARRLSREVERRHRAGERRLIFAVPFNWSPHQFVLRHWVQAAGLDPDRQIQWMVLPPSRMADMLKEGVIDGFCSGAPWPQSAQLAGHGEVLFSDPDYWTLKPDKILGVREAWAEANPQACISLCRALLRAGAWASDSHNQDDLIRILSRNVYVNAPQDAISLAFNKLKVGHILDPHLATFPWISHAKWFLGQISRSVATTQDVDFDQLARNIYRPDLWRVAAEGLGLDCPLADEKVEGGQKAGWEIDARPNNIAMPDNLFFDGGVFRSLKP